MAFSGLWKKQAPGQSDPWATLVRWLGIETAVRNPTPECGREGGFTRQAAWRPSLAPSVWPRLELRVRILACGSPL